MPSRILREGINSSELIDALSPEAELLYRRLMSVVDDYGRFHASPATVRGACWPTHPEKVCEQDVSKWLAECAQTDSSGKSLITLYSNGKSKYLQINNFGQQIRTKSRFPEPCEQSENNLISDCEQNACTSRISNFVFRISDAHTQSGAEPPAAADVRAFPQPKNPPPESPSRRFGEFTKAYPRQTKLKSAEQEFIKRVRVCDEPACFACLERYLESDEVSRNVVMNPDNWLIEQHQSQWKTDWPRAPGKTLDPTSAAIEEIKRSMREKEGKRVG